MKYNPSLSPQVNPREGLTEYYSLDHEAVTLGLEHHIYKICDISGKDNDEWNGEGVNSE